MFDEFRKLMTLIDRRKLRTNKQKTLLLKESTSIKDSKAGLNLSKSVSHEMNQIKKPRVTEKLILI